MAPAGISARLAWRQLDGQPWQAAQVQAYRRLVLPPAGVAWRPGLEVGVMEWRLDGELVGVQTLVLW